jgi:hypothetical protein
MRTSTVIPRRGRRASLAFAAVISSCVIAACGSSASTTSTSTAAKAASASAATSSSRGRSSFAACLQQHGVTPPAGRPTGAGTGTHAGPPAGAGSGNPTRAAALKACGATGQRPQSSGG